MLLSVLTIATTPAASSLNLKHLEKFFRNLLLGETNELKNRYLVIAAPEEFTPQADPTSTRQVPDKLIPDNISVRKVIEAVGNNQLSVKEMMQSLSLADRENVLANYLNPAIKDGFVRLLYPDSPRHPRQKYLLTVKGVAAFHEGWANYKCSRSGVVWWYV